MKLWNVVFESSIMSSVSENCSLGWHFVAPMCDVVWRLPCFHNSGRCSWNIYLSRKPRFVECWHSCHIHLHWLISLWKHVWDCLLDEKMFDHSDAEQHHYYCKVFNGKFILKQNFLWPEPLLVVNINCNIQIILSKLDCSSWPGTYLTVLTFLTLYNMSTLIQKNTWTKESPGDELASCHWLTESHALGILNILKHTQNILISMNTSTGLWRTIFQHLGVDERNEKEKCQNNEIIHFKSHNQTTKIKNNCCYLCFDILKSCFCLRSSPYEDLWKNFKY